MTNSTEQSRDRAFMRHVKVRKEDRERFIDFLATIPRERLLDHVKVENDTHILYHVKLKKQELLYVELAFKVDMKKSRQRKKRTLSQMGLKI